MDSDVKEIETQTSCKGESWRKLSFVRSQSPEFQELTKLSFMRLQSDETQDNLQQSPTRHRQDLKESHPFCLDAMKGGKRQDPRDLTPSGEDGLSRVWQEFDRQVTRKPEKGKST